MKNLYEEMLKINQESLLRDALYHADDSLDKREGSIIYDTLAPLCVVVSDIAALMYDVCVQSRYQTATGEHLDLCGSQLGIARTKAKHAKWKAELYPSGDYTGQKFVSSEGLGLTYRVIGKESDGLYVLSCEAAGKLSGADHGALEPLENIPSLKRARLVRCVDGGRDAQSDDAYRMKIHRELAREAFGGNFADYKRIVFDRFAESDITGIQLSPAFNGEGTVKLCVVTDTPKERYVPVPNAVLTLIKNTLDPISSGAGAGLLPLGHRLTVSTVARHALDIDVRVNLKPGFDAPDERMRQNILAASKAYLDEIRSEAVTKESDGFPFDGYACRFVTTKLIAEIYKRDSRIASATIRQGDHALSDFETPEGILPYLEELLVNGNRIRGDES